MTQSLKIIIPTAGLATRMRPQTWSKPKSLVSVAGRPALDHLLDMFGSVSALTPAVRGTSPRQGAKSVEYVLILGPGLGQTQIPPFMQEHHPN